MTTRKHIRGNHMDNGYIGERARLTVERKNNGRWVAVDPLAGDNPIKATALMRDGVAREITIVSAASESEQKIGYGFAWKFSPDKGECERVGLPLTIVG